MIKLDIKINEGRVDRGTTSRSRERTTPICEIAGEHEIWQSMASILKSRAHMYRRPSLAKIETRGEIVTARETDIK